ncbi:MAG: hypothetical protein ACW99Q_21295 [Candidatus Kariarchaeaceae archaeon]|jgi:hypothetical protein
MKKKHEDQKKVLVALSTPWEYWASDENMGIRGLTVEQLVQGTGLSREKILLSLGWLEEEESVAHDMGVERKVIDYFGHSNVTIPGTQKTVRLFYLTGKGKEFVKGCRFYPCTKRYGISGSS